MVPRAPDGAQDRRAPVDVERVALQLRIARRPPGERHLPGAARPEGERRAGRPERGGRRRVGMRECRQRPGGGQEPVRLDLAVQRRYVGVRTDDDRAPHLRSGRGLGRRANRSAATPDVAAAAADEPPR